MADSHLSQSPPTSTRSHISHHHHHIRRHRMPSGSEEQEEEELDPRIQVELEKLNRASEEINRLELELDDARAAFRTVLSDSTQRLNGLAKKLGACVDKARPYYDARMRLKEAHLESQKAALRFERACSMHEAAKEMVQLAEEGYKRREQDLDPTWQEMLNHATMKVNDAERERIESEEFHQQTTVNFKHKEEEVHKLQKDLKRAITKSKPYFEMKAKFNQVMEDHKRTVSRLEEDVCSAKSLYSEALRSLEAISDDIHRQRLERRQKLQLGVRGAGVGAEAPSPPPSWEKGASIEGSASIHMYDSDVVDDPLNVSHGSYSAEMVLGVDQLKGTRSRGIVCHESAYRKKASLTDLHIQEGKYRTDPLEVVVFKTSSLDYLNASSLPRISDSFQPPSVIHHERDRARSASYRAAIESSESQDNKEGGPSKSAFDTKDDQGDNVVTPTPENVLHSFQVKTSQNVEVEHKGLDLSVSGSCGRDSSGSPLSGSPKSSRKRDIELSQSSISRAQEWVNKSPVPQQRRVVKSKSLIEDSPKSLSITPPQNTDLSSSLTTEAVRGMRGWENKERRQIPSDRGETTSSSTSWASPIDVIPGTSKTFNNSAITVKYSNEPAHLSTSPFVMPSQNSPRSLSSTPEQASPLSGSPTLHRKSPKLQGLILRVDASSIKPSSASTSNQQSKDRTYSSANINHNPKVVISTQQPTLDVFKEKSPPPQLAPSTTQESPSSQSSIPLSTKPPTSLISQHLNKVMNVTKISAYNSKTAPSTLSTSYHLPSSLSKRPSPLTTNPPTTHSSPVRNPLSPNPQATTSSLRHHLISSIPSSPSTDRFSLSGRSDSLSASSGKGAFLKPPSDSSDTESIASTGPMLDDDQVELINMDFTENSIATDINDDHKDDGVETADPASVRRGHWSRMSLPPRLSYLEGFLERTRLYTGDDNIHTQEDGNGWGSLETNDDEAPVVSSPTSENLQEAVSDLRNVAYNHRDGDGNIQIQNNSDGPGIGYEPGLDVNVRHNNSDVSVTVNLELAGNNVVGEINAKEHIDSMENMDDLERESSISVNNSVDDHHSDVTTEATIVVGGEKGFEVNSNTSNSELENTSNVTENEENSTEHFV